MPASTADWSAVRATWAATGSFADAARAHDLDPAAVRVRAMREGWKAAQAVTLAKINHEARPAVLRSVTPAHVTIAEEGAKRSMRSKLNASRYVDRTLHHAAGLAYKSPEMALAAASDVKAVIGVAQGANMPGFEREARDTKVSVNILSIGQPEPVFELPEA